jgi:hypothetical protein
MSAMAFRSETAANFSKARKLQSISVPGLIGSERLGQRPFARCHQPFSEDEK